MKETFEIYTDGGYSMQHKKGAYAFIILKNGKEWKRQGIPIFNETNNRCEIKAILNAVKSLPKKAKASIFSDSQYALGILGNSYWKAKANTDLVDEYKEYVEKNELDLEYYWVRGHNGNKWNEECDAICNKVAGVNLNSGFVKKAPEKEKKIVVKKLDDVELLKLYKAIKRELKNRGKL